MGHKLKGVVQSKVGAYAQPSAIQLIGALTVVGAYDLLVVKCVIGRLPERVGGQWLARGHSWGCSQACSPSAHPLNMLALLRQPYTEHRGRLWNYVVGLRSQLGVPSPRITPLGY